MYLGNDYSPYNDIYVPNQKNKNIDILFNNLFQIANTNLHKLNNYVVNHCLHHYNANKSYNMDNINIWINIFIKKL